MRASTFCFRVAVLAALIGMAWGITMAMSQNHATMPAHAHLNLLGWVSLFLFGVFYRLHPALDSARIALIQACIWIIGVAIMIVGVTLIMTQRAGGDPLAAVGSLIAIGDMALFGWLVFRQKDADPARM